MNGETHEQPRGGKSTAQPRGRGDAEEPFDLPWNEGFELTLNIHEWGQAVVFKGTLQSVMQKRAQVLAYGPDPRAPRSTGPLAVEIYEAE